MNRSISKARGLVSKFLQDNCPDLIRQASIGENIPLHAEWLVRITRSNGDIEESFIPENIVTAEGLNQLALLGITNTNSPFAWLAIGTVSTAFSLGNTVLQFGEVARKAPVTIGTSKDLMIMVATYAGGLNSSLTNVALASAAMVNHVNSGLGVTLNLTNSVNATLQSCDYLSLECRVRVGSHAL